MKVLMMLKKILFVIFAVAYFSFALFMTILLLNFNKYNVTQIGDTSLIILNDEVSIDNYEKGDLILVKETKLEDIDVGDTIFAYKVDSDGYPHIQVGKVGKTYPEEKAVSFENGDTYAIDFVAGKSTKIYHDLGKYLSIIESQWGFLFIVLVPCFLIFIYELYALIIEIKYGNNPENNDNINEDKKERNSEKKKIEKKKAENKKKTNKKSNKNESKK